MARAAARVDDLVNLKFNLSFSANISFREKLETLFLYNYLKHSFFIGYNPYKSCHFIYDLFLNYETRMNVHNTPLLFIFNCKHITQKRSTNQLKGTRFFSSIWVT